MLNLQEEGLAAVSDTTVHGHHCLRAAINNHRTRGEDLELPSARFFASAVPSQRTERPATRVSNDAVDCAITQCRWYKEVRVKISTVTRPKRFLSAELCSLRSSGILRTKSAGSSGILGLVIGRAKMNVFAARAAELAEARPELAAAESRCSRHARLSSGRLRTSTARSCG